MEIYGQKTHYARSIRIADRGIFFSGDDVRAIDWNVTARFNAPFVKEYLFTDRVEKFVSPGKGKKHVLKLLRELIYHSRAKSMT